MKVIGSYLLIISTLLGLDYPGKPPGAPKVTVLSNKIEIGTKAISLMGYTPWDIKINSPYMKNPIKINNDFIIELADGRKVSAKDFHKSSPYKATKIKGSQKSLSLHKRFSGSQISANFSNKDIVIKWKAEVRYNDNYIRQHFTLSSVREQKIKSFKVFNAKLPALNNRKEGVVQGSPIVSGNIWIGLEHPMSFSEMKENHGICEYRSFQISPKNDRTFSLVIGAFPNGQLRRAFSYYLNRLRPRPYKPLVHYNSWYDIAHSNRGPFSEKETLDTINVFVKELTKKRQVKLDSIMLDDGWDDYKKSLWKFHCGWPNELKSVGELCKKNGLGPGIWLSPWGGYGYRKTARVKTANQLGVGALQLGRPGYFKIFSEFCYRMMKKYGCNHFKFDGIGAGNSGMGAFNTSADFDAAMKMFVEMRKINPDVYINLTTGTWPSPFWMLSADSIWRSGIDHSFAGVGSDRQKWITYRDQITYEKIVKNAPLFPLNSVMNHGVVFAKHAHHLQKTDDKDFRDEVRAFVACGTQMQEYYLTPSLLNKTNWDDLAESIQWLRKNSSVLADTHWIGGDPKELAIYGWAAWSKKKSIITLRNPSDKKQRFSQKVSKLLEVPARYSTKFSLRNGFPDQKRQLSTSKGVLTVELDPFEVLVIECLPK